LIGPKSDGNEGLIRSRSNGNEGLIGPKSDGNEIHVPAFNFIRLSSLPLALANG
jgi:hypothetical protein